ncbi:MAG: hypothetical protein ACFFCQ_14665 [Promethearchaeota archaeon]
MKDNNDLLEVAHLVTNHTISKFPQKIAVIAMYGSVAVESQSKYSDLDMYAIVDDLDLVNPNLQFIFQNRAIDLWRMDWERAKKIASGEGDPDTPWCVGASLFSNCKILYSRSEEDRKHFEKLIKLIKQTEENKERNLQRIINKFSTIHAYIERMHFAELNKDFLSARWASWELINRSCIILSWLNNKYYTKNWGSNIQQVIKLPIIPKDFEQLVKVIATSQEFDEMISTGRLLITRLRSLIYEKQQKLLVKKKDSSTLSDDFVGIKEYLGKIYSACNEQDILLASYAASELQVWITELVSEIKGKPAADFNLLKEINEFYIDLGFPDLSDFISNNDFEGLRQATTILEQLLFHFLTDNGANILNFHKLKDVRSYLNSKRTNSC